MHYLEKELFDRISNGDKIFDFIQNSVLDGIWYWDLEKPYNSYISPGFYRAYGYDSNEDLPETLTWTNMIHPEDFARSQNLMNAHFENPSIPFDQIVRYQHKNGTNVWIRCKGIAIRDEQGKPIRMLGIHSALNASFLNQYQQELKEQNVGLGHDDSILTLDFEDNNKFLGDLFESTENDEHLEAFFKEVTERAELSNKIQSKNELLELLVAKTEDFVLVFNEKLQLIYSNKQYEQIIGYKIEKYPMDLSESINFIHPDHQAIIFEKYENARLKNQKNITEQHKANNIDGKEIWLEDHVTFEYDSEGNYKRAYIISRDITKRKLMEFSLEKESQKRKEIAELLIEEKEIGKEELYINLKETVESILLASKADLENSVYLENKYIQTAYQHLLSAIDEVQKIALESSSQFVFEHKFIDGISEYFKQINQSSRIHFEVQNQLIKTINLNETQKKHLFRICQELAQNASKHSKANKMIFRFKQENNRLILIAKDNGIGCEEYKIENGIGIKNIQNRVYLMNGTIRFFYFKKTGLAIYISITDKLAE